MLRKGRFRWLIPGLNIKRWLALFSCGVGLLIIGISLMFNYQWLAVLEDIVLPPHGKRPPGRPKNKRHTQLREEGFKKAKITCNNCGQHDRNRKTCKNVRPYDQE